MDFVGYEYKINTDIQHRLKVFETQILHDIYVTINTHDAKMLSLKYVFDTLDYLLSKDIIVSPKTDRNIILMIKKITFKKVLDEDIKYYKYHVGRYNELH